MIAYFIEPKYSVKSKPLTEKIRTINGGQISGFSKR